MEMKVIKGILNLEFWYIKGQDGNWYRSEKEVSEPFDEKFWMNFGYVPWYGF